jgi:predicted permease
VNVLNFRRTDRPPAPPGQSSSALYRSIDPDYFPVMGIPIVAGRNFTGADREGSLPVIIIGREMARRYWPGENALGKRLTIDGPERTIVGIVGDVRSEYHAAPPQPEMYLPHGQSGDRSLTMVVETDRDPAQILTEARTVVQAFDPKLPLIGPGTMRQLVDDAVAQPRFYLLLASLFAMLAVVLAAVGVYGVVAYLVSQRTREIGVRMALGARAAEVVGLVLWAGLKPALLGSAIGVALAVSGASVMRSLLYEVAPRDTPTVLLVTVLLLATVVVACVIPAVRAIRIPPSHALRAE